MDLKGDVRRLATIGTFFIWVGWIFVIYSLIAGIVWWIDLAQRAAFNLFEAFAISAGGPPNPILLARNAYISMIETAQNVADRYELTREEIAAFALRSQHRSAAAREDRHSIGCRVD